MTKGLPSSLKSHICLHVTIPSSPPIALTYLPQVVFYEGQGAAKKHNQSHFTWLGRLRSGEENSNSYFTPSIEEYYYIWNKTHQYRY